MRGFRGTVPPGKASVVREGGDVTIVACGRMVGTSLAATDRRALGIVQR
jgi:pyruvate/2-oxoglutarate/acetoin dehydrogenase E1 component